MEIKRGQFQLVVQMEIEKQKDGIFSKQSIAELLNVRKGQVLGVIRYMNCVVAVENGKSNGYAGQKRLPKDESVCSQCRYGNKPGLGPTCVILHPELKSLL